MIYNLGYTEIETSRLPAPKYTYSGRSEFIDDKNGNWRIKFFTSGTLNFTDTLSAGKLDLFLVAGGGSGGSGDPGSDGYAGRGGRGGNGGECKTIKNIRFYNKSYNIIIGDPGQNTSIKDKNSLSLSAISGGGAPGGAGATGIDGSGGNGSYGTPEFNEPDAKRYAGGGGGGTRQGAYGQGRDGGGNGNWNNGLIANSGGGGGGGGYGYYDAQSGFAGASGILIIRNHRK